MSQKEAAVLDNGNDHGSFLLQQHVGLPVVPGGLLCQDQSGAGQPLSPGLPLLHRGLPSFPAGRLSSVRLVEGSSSPNKSRVFQGLSRSLILPEILEQTMPQEASLAKLTAGGFCEG